MNGGCFGNPDQFFQCRVFFNLPSSYCRLVTSDFRAREWNNALKSGGAGAVEKQQEAYPDGNECIAGLGVPLSGRGCAELLVSATGLMAKSMETTIFGVPGFAIDILTLDDLGSTCDIQMHMTVPPCTM